MADGSTRRGSSDRFYRASDENGIGEISFVGDTPGALTDLDGLAAYDSNGDGQLSAADERFGDFLVWVDSNQN